MNKIKKQLEEVKLRISQIANSANKVKLIAVSKRFPPEYIQTAYDAGHRRFGENKVQELITKQPILPKDIEWHLIGHLQSNKVVKAVQLAHYIHSVDSMKILNKIDNSAEKYNKKPKILLQVNISEEESKTGITVKEIDEFVRISLECKNLELVGFMTMAPFNASECELRNIFASLCELRNNIEKKYNMSLPELSMGMSSDYHIAIDEGSTFVRVGTSIFGKREPL